MSIIGNILLGFATLILFNLVTSIHNKPMPGGDAGVGYAWAMIMLNLGFFISMLLVAVIIASKGGFEWVAATRSKRILYVTIGILATLIYATLCGVMKNEKGDVPGILRSLISFSYLLVPVILIISSAILLNSGLKAAVPEPVYKWPLAFVTLLSVVGLCVALFAFMIQSAKQNVALREARQSYVDENHTRILGDIDSCDVMTRLGTILVFTGDNQPANIQTAAVTKIKTNPAWEQELIRLIDSNYSTEVFQFLASNNVDHPDLFLEPVRSGLLAQADLIRERIRRCSHPSHFSPGMFSWEIERIIRTVDKFYGKGVDYLPAMKEISAAFDEPSDIEKPKLEMKSIVDQWIKAHS